MLYQHGIDREGKLHEVLVCSPGSHAYNPAFDITPARLVSGIITEKGIVKADKDSISLLFEEIV